MSATPSSRANLERVYAPRSLTPPTKPNSTKPTTLVIRNEGYEKSHTPKPAPARLSAQQRMERAAEVAAQAFIEAGGMSL